MASGHVTPSSPLIGCSYPGLGSLFILALGVLFFTLFTNFYIQSYTKKAAALKKSKEQ